MSRAWAWCLPLPYPCVCLAKLLTTASTASLRMVLARASDTEPATGRRLGGTGGADFVFDLAMLDVMPTQPTLCLSRENTQHTNTQINIQSMGQTHVKHTERFPFAFTSFQKERAKARNTRGTADATFVSAACCFAPGWTNFPCDQIGGAPRKYFLLLLFKGERTGAWELANDRFLWRIK